MKVTIIGSGNVATHLAKVLHLSKGVLVNEIFSKNIQHAENLANELNAIKKNRSPITITNQMDFEQSKSKLFILAVKDEVISQVVSEIKLPKNVFFVHTSGSTPLEILYKINEKTTKIGVFYPLQTFSKEKKEFDKKKIVQFWQNIPICIQADETAINDFLYKIANKLTSKIYQINSEQRQILHIGATFACNFSNFMYYVAKEILQKAELPFEILENLVKETAQKAFLMPPFDAQTGVAKRGDMQIIEIHQQKLANEPQIQALYTHITKDILALYHKEV